MPTQEQFQVAVVTGAASGIGEALARELAAQGVRLALVDVNEARLQALAEALVAEGAQCLARSLDVTQAQALTAFAAEVDATWGRVDMVFNNAGVTLLSGLEAASLEDAHWQMDINFWGVVHGCRAFLPMLRRQGHGTLVNISSIFAMISVPGQSFYNASKAAVRGFSDALREELHGSGVRLLCVHPGGVKTRIVEDARVRDLSLFADSHQALSAQFADMARTTPQAAAQVILAAVRDGRRRVLIGADASIMDLLFRLFPARASGWISAAARARRLRAQRKAELKADRALR